MQLFCQTLISLTGHDYKFKNTHKILTEFVSRFTHFKGCISKVFLRSEPITETKSKLQKLCNSFAKL